MATPDETNQALRALWRSGLRPPYDPTANKLLHQQQLTAWHRACRQVPHGHLMQAVSAWCGEPDRGWPQPVQLLRLLPKANHGPALRVTGAWQQAFATGDAARRRQLLKMMDEACAAVDSCDRCRGRRADCSRCTTHILGLADQAVQETPWTTN